MTRRHSDAASFEVIGALFRWLRAYSYVRTSAFTDSLASCLFTSVRFDPAWRLADLARKLLAANTDAFRAGTVVIRLPTHRMGRGDAFRLLRLLHHVLAIRKADRQRRPINQLAKGDHEAAAIGGACWCVHGGSPWLIGCFPDDPARKVIEEIWWFSLALSQAPVAYPVSRSLVA